MIITTHIVLGFGYIDFFRGHVSGEIWKVIIFPYVFHINLGYIPHR